MSWAEVVEKNLAGVIRHPVDVNEWRKDVRLSESLYIYTHSKSNKKQRTKGIATRNKCIVSSNKCLTTSSKKLIKNMVSN